MSPPTRTCRGHNISHRTRHRLHQPQGVQTMGWKLMSPLDAMFLLAESREHPVHVGAPAIVHAAARGRTGIRAATPMRRCWPATMSSPCFASTGDRSRRHHQRRLVLRQRHRAGLPRAAVGVARAGTGSRPARIDLTSARQPARPAPATMGGTPHRGSARRTIRGLHQAAPRTGRRHIRTAANTALIEHRSA